MKTSVVVPFNPGDPDRDRLWDWCERRWHLLGAGEIVAAPADNSGGGFSHAQGINRAAREATGDIWVIVEADIALDVDCLAEACYRVRSGEAPWALAQRYVQLTPSATDEVLALEPGADLSGFAATNRWREAYSWLGEGVSWCGGIVLERASFEAVGGYDERFDGWSGDDLAFAASLRVEVGSGLRVEGTAYHLWHPRDGLDKPAAHLVELQERYRCANREEMRELIASRP